MMLSEDDLVGAAKSAKKAGNKKAGKKPAPLADDNEPLVTVATVARKRLPAR